MTAADAHPWSNPGNLGAIETAEMIYRDAKSFATKGCKVDCGYGCYSGECMSADGSMVSYHGQFAGDGADCYEGHEEIRKTRIDQTIGDWTYLSVLYDYGACGGNDGGARWDIFWQGTLNPDWPSNSRFTVEEHHSFEASTEEWTDPACAWRSTQSILEDGTKEWAISVASTDVLVTSDGECGTFRATIGQEDTLFVDPNTWETSGCSSQDKNPCKRSNCSNSGEQAPYLGVLIILGLRRRIASTP